jgi:hypothetical protein
MMGMNRKPLSPLISLDDQEKFLKGLIAVPKNAIGKDKSEIPKVKTGKISSPGYSILILELFG